MDKQNSFDTQQHPSETASSQPVNSLKDKQSPSLQKDWHRPQENGLNLVYLSEVVEQRSHLLMPVLGYGLLLFALFDYIHIVIPSRFTDPAWELQTIGALVEHVAVPLLGLLFVFYRNQGYILKWERHLLGVLSWICLLVGLLYLLMLPLGIADSWRLYYANKTQVAERASQQRQHFQQVKGQLNQAKNDQQIKQVVTSLTPKIRSEDIKNPQAFKDQFLNQISEGEQRIQVQANKVWTDQSQTLIKNSVKWNLGALVSGVLFIWIWCLSDWARRKEY